MKESTWVGRAVGPGVVDSDNPWPGLAAFREADQAFFKGRDSVVNDLVRLLLRSPVTVLFGVSGLGKTSLLRAGVFPLLRQNAILPVYVRLQHAEGGPGLRLQVLNTLVQAAEDASVEAVEPDPDATLWEHMHRKDVRFWNERNRLVTPILVFDQFEEVFTVGAAHPERRARTDAFLNELADLVEARPPAAVKARLEERPEEALRYSLADRPCKVLFSLREDFLAELTGLAARMPSLAQHAFRLQRMNQDEALRVVQVEGLVPEDVARRVVEFVAAGVEAGPRPDEAAPVEPALLSVFCRELNHKRRAQGRQTITADLVEGNAGTIIADFYNRTISDPNLGSGVRRLVEEKLLTQSGFRNSVAEEEALLEPGVSAEDIDRLIELRLLRREETGTRGYTRIELTHDVLTDPIRASRDRRRVREQEERKLAELREFELQERRRADETRRRRILAVLTLLALAAIASAVIAVVSAVIAARQRGLANRELSASDVERVLLGDSEPLPHLARAVTKDPDNDLPRAALFMQLASAIPRVGLLHHVRGVRSAAFAGSADRVVVLGQDGSAHLVRLDIALPPVTREAESFPAFAADVARVGVSRDGTRAVTAAGDGTVLLWRLRGDAAVADDVLPPFSAIGGVADLQLTADGSRAAVVTFDGQVRAWTTGDRSDVVSFSIAPLAVPQKLQFDAGGTRLLVAADEGARLWDATTGRAIASPLDGAGEVLDASFSPDGGRILALVRSPGLDGGDPFGTVRVWGAAGEPLVSPDSELVHGRFTRAVFGPRGESVSTAAPGGIVRTWEIPGGVPLGAPMRHDARVHHVAFSADGSRLLTASDDRAGHLWDPRTGDAIGWPLRHHAPLRDAAFSPDGIAILTTSDDGFGHLWDVRRGAIASLPVPHPSGVSTAVFSPDASSLLTTAEDGVARLWRTANGALLAAMKIGAPAAESVQEVAFSADGARIVTRGPTQALLWDANGRPEEGVARMPLLPPDRTGVWLVTTRFTATGDRLVSVLSSGVTTLWDARSGAPVRSHTVGAEAGESEPAVAIAAFNPRQPTFATAAGARAALWDLESGKAVGRPMEHSDHITSIDFHPSGRFLVTASMDRTARIWHAGTGEPVGGPLHDEDALSGAVFSDGGTEVVTTSKSGAVHVWDVRGALSGRVSDSRASMLKIDAVTLAQPSRGRVFTGGEDGGLRAWSAQTGASMGPALRHPGAIRSLVVSRDGSRIATVSTVKGVLEPMVRIWDVPVGRPADAALLRDVAEGLEGHRLGDDGVLVDLGAEERQATMARVRARAMGADDVAGRFVHWFLADPPARTVTPLSAVTLERYLEAASAQAGAGLETYRAFGWLAPPLPDGAQTGSAAVNSQSRER